MERIEREEWQEPQLKSVGNVAELVRGGDGKLSLVSEDSGDSGKPPGEPS